MKIKYKKYNFYEFINILILFLGIGRYYLGPFALISYFLASLFAKYKFKFVEILLLYLLLFCFLLSTLFFGLANSLLLFGFHWGFIIYYLFFKKYAYLFNVKKIFIILTSITVFEGILVNTILDPTVLPNYPIDSESTHYTFFWQRALSFGGNASVTGVLIIVLMSLLPFSRNILIFSGISLIFVASGSGILAYFAYLFKNFKKFNNFISFFIMGSFSSVIYFLFITYGEKVRFFQKASFFYINLLLNQKLERLLDLLNKINFNELVLGSLNYENAGGDTSYLNFFACHGLIGILILLIFAKVNLSKKNYFPIFLMLLFNFHYHIIFSAPGQVIFGYLLSLNNQELDNQKNN